MKHIFFAFAALLMILTACKKDNNTDIAGALLIGTWNQVDLTTKVANGKSVKFNEGGSMEGTALPGYSSYEIKDHQLVFKGSSGTVSNTFAVSSDSLFIDPNIVCLDPKGCATLYAKQK